MARQINLLLVRHAISEANLDKTVNARLPDSRVPLAPEGHDQAAAAGEAIAKWLTYLRECGGNGGIGGTRILCSPYLRTRETSAQIEKKLTEAQIKFDKREELALREISFGLFDGISDEELPTRFPLEHAHYQKHVDFEGEFYAPMPLGESRAQVADRVKGVFGTIIRDNTPKPAVGIMPGFRIKNFIIVSHGVTLRAFQMQWMHKTPEWYSEQKNPNNASVSLIQGMKRHPLHDRPGAVPEAGGYRQDLPQACTAVAPGPEQRPDGGPRDGAHHGDEVGGRTA
jgi:2,3-bisphosphoglycerate-dependent phosphoglycerate mutase